MILKEIADRVKQANQARERARRRNQAKGLALGVRLGATLGAVAGILFAPRAGKETRQEIAQRGNEAWKTVKDRTAETKARLATSVEEKSAQLRDVAIKGVEAARESLCEPSSEREEKKTKKS